MHPTKLLFQIKIGLVVFCLAGGLTETLWAQDEKPRILAVAVQVQVDKTLHSARVQESIRVQLNGLQNQTITLHAVPFQGVQFDNVTLSWNQQTTTCNMTQNEHGLWQSKLKLDLPSNIQETEFTVNYQVDCQSDKLSVPLIYVPWTPEESTTDLFTARVSLPTGTKLIDSFPTQSTPVPAAKQAGGPHLIQKFQLSAIPSVLRLKIVDEDDSSFGLGTLIDIGVLISLCVIGLAGWKFRKWIV